VDGRCRGVVAQAGGLLLVRVGRHDLVGAGTSLLFSYYQSLIGVLHSIVGIGRVDIVTEPSKLASHVARGLREGAVFHTFSYLKGKHRSRMVYNPIYLTIDTSVSKQCD
jgi:hypothetical protein